MGHPNVAGFLIAMLFMVSTAFFGWDWYDRYYALPYKNVEIVNIEKVDEGYRIQVTFDKVSGELTDFSTQVISDGFTRRARYLDYEQPEGVSSDRPLGENLIDIVVLTNKVAPEAIVLRVDHELIRDGKPYIESNEFLRIDQEQLQGF